MWKALLIIVASLALIMVYPIHAEGHDPYADYQGMPYEDPDSHDYSTFGRWAKTCLTHRADPVLEDLYVEAFAMWSAVANIRDCGAVEGGEDIRIIVNLALPSPVVGQAATTTSGGSILHCEMRIKLAILPVVAHELGHCLGLLHSEFRDALMAPFCCNPLSPDDVAGIVALYGARPGATITPTPTFVFPTATPNPPTATPTATPTPALFRRFVPALARD